MGCHGNRMGYHRNIMIKWIKCGKYKPSKSGMPCFQANPCVSKEGSPRSHHLFGILKIYPGSSHSWLKPYQVPSISFKHCWLVVSIPLKNTSQLGWLCSIYGKIRNVPNHQSDWEECISNFASTERQVRFLTSLAVSSCELHAKQPKLWFLHDETFVQNGHTLPLFRVAQEFHWRAGSPKTPMDFLKNKERTFGKTLENHGKPWKSIWIPATMVCLGLRTK